MQAQKVTTWRNHLECCALALQFKGLCETILVDQKMKIQRMGVMNEENQHNQDCHYTN